jgi:long-chain fatty acid transport protein
VVVARAVALALLLGLGAGWARAGGLTTADNGTRALGRGGAFTVKADDLSALYYNPAGLVHSPGRFTFLYNHNFVNLAASFRREAWDHDAGAPFDFAAGGVPNPVSNSWGWFNKGGMLVAASDLGTRRAVVALGVYGPPSVGGVRFPADGAQKYLFVEHDVLMLYYTLAGALRLTETLAVGLALQWVDLPRNRYSLVVDGYNDSHYRPFGSDQDLLATLDVSDRFSPTAIAGVWWRPHPAWEVALAGRLVPIWLRARGHLSLAPLGALVQPEGGAVNYSLLKCPAGGGTSGCVEGADGAGLRLVFPPTLRGGVRYRHLRQGRELFDLELDLLYEAWSMLQRFDVSTDASHVRLTLRDGSSPTRPIGSLDVEKRYRDTLALRLGGDLSLVPGWLTVRAGAYYESAAGRTALTNLDFLPLSSLGVGGGFSLAWRGLTVSGAYLHVFQERVVVSEEEAGILQARPAELCSTDPGFCDPHYPGLAAPPVNSGTFDSRVDLLSLGASLTF